MRTSWRLVSMGLAALAVLSPSLGFADDEASSLGLADEGKPEADVEEEAHHLVLGIRGFGGAWFTEGESRAIFGPGVLAAVHLWGPFELEGSLALAFVSEGEPFAALEAVFKWVLEREAQFSPHLTLGPLFSIDFEDPLVVSGGLIAGGGATWWISPRVGVTGDINYRLLVGSEIGHVVTGAAGVAWRFF